MYEATTLYMNMHSTASALVSKRINSRLFRLHLNGPHFRHSSIHTSF